jgi:hypothetical protein
VNGRPEAIESIYMKSPEAWDRFMRFMEDMETNGLAPKLIKLKVYSRSKCDIIK